MEGEYPMTLEIPSLYCEWKHEGPMVSRENAVILIAEDRADDVMLIRRAFSAAKVNNPVMVVRDGEEAMAYLEGFEKYADRQTFPLPDLMLLDLKMPKMDGFDVLRAIRSRPQLRHLRVIVLTSSEDLADVNKAYELGASSFLVKPLEFDNFADLMRTLNYFWLKRNSFAAAPTDPLSETAAGQQASRQN
jgi:CheY-like chemotaxis protein